MKRPELSRSFKHVGTAVIIIAVTVFAVWWGVNWAGGLVTITEDDVQRAVVATLQQESPASFYVTGTMELTVTATVENTKVFLPQWVGFSLGTSTATVRLPGRALYGFDIRALDAEDIRLREDGRVEVHIPELRVYAVDPALSEMEVRTEEGWARAFGDSEERVRHEALRVTEEALLAQARQRLARSEQPRIHAAEALRKLLAPVLKAAGVENPRIVIQVTPELIMNPAG